MTVFIFLAVLAAAAYWWVNRPQAEPPQTWESKNDWVTRAPPPKPAIDPHAPFEWFTTENYNECCEWNLLNATVFSQDDGYKYVVNVNGGTKKDAVFSKRFDDEEDAMHAAEAKMKDLLAESFARRA